jgi:hypothetical protein
MQAAFAAAVVDPAVPVPAGLVTARGGADEKRFAIYRNNVAVGLRKALSSRFPVVERLVGADFFALMARAYVAGAKPASPLLFAYGDDFPDFVAGFEPAGSVPYLADVARIEAAITVAYHAADAAPLALDAVAAIAADSLPRACLCRHPSATLVRSPWPVGSIWHAHRSVGTTAMSATGAQAVLVVRPAFEVAVHVLPARDADFAGALLAGDALGLAAGKGDVDGGFDFGSALVGLIGLGAFAGLDLTEGD